MLAAAVPFLFLHATYQPGLSVDVGSTSIDATLADLAIACVVAAAVVRGRREGWQPLRRARWLLVLVGGVRRLVAPSRSRRPSLLGEEYALAPHAISVAKFAWYAALLPAAILVVRSTREAVPLLRALVAWSVARDRLGPAPVPRRRLGVRGQAAGPARALVRRDPRLRRALGCGARRRRRRRRAGRRTPRRATLVARRARDGRARRRALRRDDRRDRALARVRGRAARRSGRARAARRAAPSRSPPSCCS